jgi:putative ABC transport system permease protein
MEDRECAHSGLRFDGHLNADLQRSGKSRKKPFKYRDPGFAAGTIKENDVLKKALASAVRVFRKNRAITIINTIGLGGGIVCATLIFMWVNDEIHFDGFHQNKDRIYRILLQRKGADEWMAVTPGLLAEAVKTEIPEVKYAARVIQNHRNPFKYENKAFYEDKSFCVDPDFFRIFTFPIVRGNAETPLERPGDMAITEETAGKYFGGENPIGKSLMWNNWSNYRISAVIKDMPANSHLRIELMEPHTLAERYWKGGYNWTNFVHETYVLIEKNSSVRSIEKKTELILNRNYQVADRHYYVHLQPLRDIHLNAAVTDSTAVTGDRKAVTVLLLIAAAILLMACVNFINISTANSMSRAKEVGIRKVVGSPRSRLVLRFLGEYSLLVLLAGFMAVLAIELILPYFNRYTGKSLSLDMHFFMFFPVVLLFTALFAGSYPAFYLSALSPAAALKGKGEHAKNRVAFRNALVIFQFLISISLLICTFIINGQLAFIQNKKLGFDKDGILYFPAKGRLAENYENMKSRLLQYPDIRGAAMQESVPTTTINGGWVRWNGQTRSDLVVRNTLVTSDYFRTMNIGLKDGRYFSDAFSTDKDAAFILNEAAVDYLELESPVGKEIQTRGRTGIIVGVVKNSHFKSLHHKMEPLIFMEMNDYRSIDLFGVVLVKFSSRDVPKLLSTLKDVWHEYNPDLPFEYHFLDQTIDLQYAFERRLSGIFTWFSLLAVAISVAGLLGLSVLLIEKRTKEIGVRKVLGASVPGIVALLAGDFTKWVVYANGIAWPVAWYAMNKWLQGFAYRMDLTVRPFVWAGLTAWAIALLTVGWQAVRAATANPVEALRDE